MSTLYINNIKKSEKSYSSNVTVGGHHHHHHRRRRRRYDMRKIAALVGATALLIVGGYEIYSHLPFVKVNKAIAAGDKYTENEDYEAAINKYEEAIKIDKHSVTAYCNMAGAFLSIDDSESAKQILYDGWQNTENEGLLDNYHAVVLNEAVDLMNTKQADLNTVLSIASVLKEDNNNKDAVDLLAAAYSRVFDDSYSYNADALFRSDASTYLAEGGSATFSYAEYETLVKDLLEVYSKAPSQELADVILSFAAPGTSSFTLKCEDIASYEALINQVEAAVGSSENLDSFKNCLVNAQEVSGIFADIFTQLDVGNVDELRSFVVSEQYLALRDLFLHGEETPQENTTYVPISREAIVLNNDAGAWSYRFLNFEENPETAGVITLWANFFEDNGVQRDSISYEPASVDGNLYPHTKYDVTYLKSYITSGKSTRVAKMNYRLETTITQEDGSIINSIIGDWGGPNEWEMDIDTIESRIRA